MQAEQQSERERFEDAMRTEGFDSDWLTRHLQDGYYVSEEMDAIWRGWQARAALSHPSPQWLPIESAPKDGTEILAWREDCGAFIALYTAPDAFPLMQSEIDECEEDWLFQRDWFTQWPQAIRLDGSEVPTHWMPLPPPPPEQGSKG